MGCDGSLMEAVVVDGEGVACEVMLLVESQGDPVTLPWLWREKGGRAEGRRRQDDYRVSSQGTE